MKSFDLKDNMKLLKNEKSFHLNTKNLQFSSKETILSNNKTYNKKLDIFSNENATKTFSLLKKMSFEDRKTTLTFKSFDSEEENQEIVLEKFSWNKEKLFNNNTNMLKKNFLDDRKDYSNKNNRNFQSPKVKKNFNLCSIVQKTPLKETKNDFASFELKKLTKKNKNLIGLPKKNTDSFNNKLKLLLKKKNNSQKMSINESLRKKFFDAFSEDDIEKISQNNFLNNFKKVKSDFLTKNELETKELIQKQRINKRGSCKMNSFLSDSENEDKILTIPSKKKMSFSFKEKNFRRKTMRNDEKIKKNYLNMLFSNNNSPKSSEIQNKNMDKSYNNTNSYFDSTKDKNIKDFGNFIILNSRKSKDSSLLN